MASTSPSKGFLRVRPMSRLDLAQLALRPFPTLQTSILECNEPGISPAVHLETSIASIDTQSIYYMCACGVIDFFLLSGTQAWRMRSTPASLALNLALYTAWYVPPGPASKWLLFT